MDDCIFSEKGEKILYATEPAKEDSLGQRELHLFIPSTGRDLTLYSTPKEGLIAGIEFNEEATAAMFYSRRDTSEAAKDLRDIFYADLTAEEPEAECIVPSDVKGIPEGMGISDKATLRLSKDGRYLVLGVKELPEPEDKTVPDFEKVKLDIWRWDADYLLPLRPPDLHRPLLFRQARTDTDACRRGHALRQYSRGPDRQHRPGPQR